MSVTAQAQPGLRDIARQLSLSVWTVSKALNGQPGVKASTRQRVLEAAQSAGYVPNRQAQILRQKRSRCIGLLLPTLSNPIYSERMEDIYEAAEERNYEVMVTSYERSIDRQTRLCRELIGRRVEAVIMSGRLSEKLLQGFIDARILVLLIHAEEIQVSGVASLNVDQTAGIRTLLGHLLKLGHRRPLLLGPWSDRPDRMAGIHDALREAGLPENELQIAGDNIRWQWTQSAYEQVLRDFSRDRRIATAIMATNDLMAIGAVAALNDLGLSVPQDVSVTGVDNITAARFCRPALTTLSQTHLNLGHRAVEMVMEILDKNLPWNTHQKLVPELVVRQSTGRAAQILPERSESC